MKNKNSKRTPAKKPQVNEKMISALNSDLDRLTGQLKEVHESQDRADSLQALEAVLDQFDQFADELTRFYQKHPWITELRKKSFRKSK